MNMERVILALTLKVIRVGFPKYKHWRDVAISAIGLFGSRKMNISPMLDVGLGMPLELIDDESARPDFQFGGFGAAIP
jgi:hypothetical protein